jgi:hypothetical protein
MAFSTRHAKLLTAGQSLALDGCPGLRLEASQTTKAWTYRYRSPVDQKLKQIKLGHWPAMSIGEAIAAWEAARGQRAAGTDLVATKRAAKTAERIAAARPGAKGGFTVRMLVDDYLSGHVDKRRTRKGSTDIRRMFDSTLGPIANVCAIDLTRKQAFDLLEANVHAPVQAAKLRTELGAAWDRALDAGTLPETTPNHWRSLMRGKIRSKGKKINGAHVGTAKRALKAAEVGELIRWLPNFSRTVADILTLYLWTGTRGAEICAIEACEITDEPTGLWWTVPKAKTKNQGVEAATDLRVPLVGRAEILVRRLAERYPTGYLFPSRGTSGHMSQTSIGKAVRFHMPDNHGEANVQRVRMTITNWAPHDLRRTARTLLGSLGCPREVGESVLGHVLPGVEGVYNLHEYDNERREWLTKLASLYEELATPPGAASTKPAATHTIPSPRAQATRPAVRLVRAA